MTEIFSCMIPGRPIIKKNTKRFFFRGGSPRVVYSKLFKEWEHLAVGILGRKTPDQLISQELHAEYIFYLKNKQGEPDVSNLIEGPQDALVKANIISDDRIIQSLSAKKIFNDPQPRTEIKLFLIGK